jgi:hypothetical protein
MLKREFFPPTSCSECKDESPQSSLPSRHNAKTVDAVELPSFPPLAGLNFTWGPRNGVDVSRGIETAYETTVKWKKNVFDLPSGAWGKDFTLEHARLNNEFANHGPLESIALKACMVFTPLMLQDPR